MVIFTRKYYHTNIIISFPGIIPRIHAVPPMVMKLGNVAIVSRQKTRCKSD